MFSGALVSIVLPSNRWRGRCNTSLVCCTLVSGVSANWARGHPWAAVYDFVVERESLSRPIGQVLFGTDTRLLYDRMRAVDEVPDGGSVLDIPCGGGVALRALTPDRQIRYIAADIAPDMLVRTEQVAHELDLDQVQ